MNETLEERKKMRRQYLSKKASGYLVLAISGCFFISACKIIVQFLMAPASSMPYYGEFLPQSFYHEILPVEGLPINILPEWRLFLFLVLVVIGGYCSYRLLRASRKTIKAIPYVPPVNMDPSILPAEEILVRGSEQPAASPSELLRAANNGTQTPSEELLRATGSEPS